MQDDPNQPTEPIQPAPPVPVTPATPPGWYADPNDPYTQRYWDGSQWTDNRAPGAAAVAPKAPTNGQAIASMVLGILFLCGIGSILALIFGHQAKREIEASNGAQGGEGMAQAGIVLGWIGIGLALAYVLFWVLLAGGGLFFSGVE